MQFFTCFWSVSNLGASQENFKIIIIHHQPINAPTAGAQAFLMDYTYGERAMTQHAGPVRWWVLTTANAAETNGLTCFAKHGGTRDNKCLVTHSMTDQRCLTSAIVHRSALTVGPSSSSDFKISKITFKCIILTLRRVQAWVYNILTTILRERLMKWLHKIEGSSFDSQLGQMLAWSKVPNMRLHRVMSLYVYHNHVLCRNFSGVCSS
jgi:hypothetical protein